MINDHSKYTPDEQAAPQSDFLNSGHLLFSNGIKVLLLRDEYNSIHQIAEVDILIKRKDLEIACQILVKDGWRVLDSGLFHPHKRSFLKYVNSIFLKFDLHLEPIDKWLIYDDVESYFVGAQLIDSAFYLPSDEVWLRHVICHIVLGKKEIAEKYKHRIPEAIKKLSIPTEKFFSKHKNTPSASWKLFTWAVKNWSEIEKNPSLLFSKRPALIRGLFSHKFNFMRFFRYHLIWKLGQILGWRKGFFIVALGPDGAGKTTFLAQLEKKLQVLQIPNRTKYMGPWEKPFLQTSKLLSKLGASPLEDQINFAIDTKSKSKIFKARTKRILYYLNLPFEIWARYLFLILPHILLRRIVLSDRYAHDILIGHHNEPIINYAGYREFVVKIAPQPDFIFLLINDAETIWKRKKEYPLDVIRDALVRYQMVAEKFKISTLKTDVSPEILVDSFITMHWEKMIDLRRDSIQFSLPFLRKNR